MAEYLTPTFGYDSEKYSDALGALEIIGFPSVGNEIANERFQSAVITGVLEAFGHEVPYEALVNYESEVDKYMHSFADYLFKIDETEEQEQQEIR